MNKTNNNYILSGTIAGLIHGICFQIWSGTGYFIQNNILKNQ